MVRKSSIIGLLFCVLRRRVLFQRSTMLDHSCRGRTEYKSYLAEYRSNILTSFDLWHFGLLWASSVSALATDAMSELYRKYSGLSFVNGELCLI